MDQKSTQSRPYKDDQPTGDPNANAWLGTGGGPANPMGGKQQDRTLVTRSKSPEAEAEREGSVAAQPITYQVPSAPEIRQYGAHAFDRNVIEALQEEVDATVVEVRPDGQVFAPWTEYAKRLDKVFGIGNWAQAPEGKPQTIDGFVMWQFSLYVGGKWVATSIGEHPDPGNRRMSLANRAESAKSDALVKNCKALGIFRELWEIEYRTAWLQLNAVHVQALQYDWSTRKVWLWRRKDRPPFFKEFAMKETDLEQGENRRDYADDARDHIDAIQEEGLKSDYSMGHR